MRKKPKKIEAEAVLELLIQVYSQGVPTRELRGGLRTALSGVSGKL